MKKIALSMALLLAPVMAQASDLPSKTKSPNLTKSESVANWNGFYVGVQMGGQNISDQWYSKYDGGDANYPSISELVAVGGIHAGYNIQSNSLVFGIEADAELSGAGPNYEQYWADGPSWWGYETKVNSQGSVRARIGYAINHALLFVTGGAAFADVDHTFYDTWWEVAFKNTFSEFAVGWTAGAGIELAIDQNWSIRGEYRYTDLGEMNSDNSAEDWGTLETNEMTINSARVGLSYKF